MTFGSADFLWLLLIIPPAIIAFFWWSFRERQKLMAQFIHSRLLAGLVVGISPRRQKARAAMIVVAVSCVLVALARPQWGYRWEEARQRGLDIVIAIDTSKSMLAEDIAPNRLARAKLAALDLMRQAKTDRLGLVAFAGTAFLQCPLTIDDSAFRQSVEALDVNTLPEGGTAVAEAIRTALNAFKERNNHKVLVLFTDGEDHDSYALGAAEDAARAGMRIYTIGIGSADGEVLRIRQPNGQTDYVRDSEGNVVKSRLNEALLQQIARVANGFYLPLRGANAVDVLYNSAQGLASLPKSESDEKWVRQPIERYHWPLGIAIVLFVFEMFVPERKRESSKTARPVGSAATAIVLGLLSLTTMHAAGSPDKAMRDYRSGRFDEALRNYEQALAKKSDDPRLYFNAGTAAYRAGKYPEAQKYFERALISADLDLQQRAYYNLGNTLYRMGEAAPEPASKKQAWLESLKLYTNSLSLRTNDVDAQFNYAFVTRQIEELKRQEEQQQNPEPPAPPSDAARKAKEEADKAVLVREYGRALQIMEDQLKIDSTTAFYSDYIQRLRDINHVEDPAHL